MSVEKGREESGRWLLQARADMKAAEGSLSLGSFEWACFQSQQAAEKALKAFWFYHSEDPWGHSLVKLIQDYPDKTIKTELATLLPQAKMLDKLYIPTRYPNGLPGSTPSEVFTEAEARTAIDTAQELIDNLAAKMAG